MAVKSITAQATAERTTRIFHQRQPRSVSSEDDLADKFTGRPHCVGADLTNRRAIGQTGLPSTASKHNATANTTDTTGTTNTSSTFSGKNKPKKNAQLLILSGDSISVHTEISVVSPQGFPPKGVLVTGLIAFAATALTYRLYRQMSRRLAFCSG